MGTRRYILRKVLLALLTLAFVVVFNFFLFRVIPSESLELLLPGTTAINPTNVEQLTQDLGLAVVIVANLVADILYTYLDPRVRAG